MTAAYEKIRLKINQNMKGLVGVRRPWTEAELATMREDSLEYVRQQGWSEKPFTCDTCSARYECALVFDLYNTDGGCLAEK